MHVPNLLSALPLLPSATPHTLILPRLEPCPPPPQTFALRSITYLRYEVSAPYSSPQPNTTQLVFELENGATGVATGCACQDVMRPDGEWADGGGSLWHACADRALAVGGRERPVKTSARIEWDAWRLAVNQTWACDKR
ncbi:hypothetical protein F4825DRAFT_447818 [Nemania diffusa]|nr:hypothetical protein F4825DRAFT_447818 [Nemania diffusa]